MLTNIIHEHVVAKQISPVHSQQITLWFAHCFCFYAQVAPLAALLLLCSSIIAKVQCVNGCIPLEFVLLNHCVSTVAFCWNLRCEIYHLLRSIGICVVKSLCINGCILCVVKPLCINSFILLEFVSLRLHLCDFILHSNSIQLLPAHSVQEQSCMVIK